ncbi:hypothetical protein HOY82DRAFT_232928 [Tuber indicum]|nr:hypothetical protein HOY82DRAFT_232928 [Tuber indicum]
MASGSFGSPPAFDFLPSFDTPQAAGTSEKTPEMASKRSPPVPFDLFASSEMFTIRAGSDLQPFHFHKELLAQLSDEMRHRVYNDVREGPANTWDLKDMPPEAIHWFMEFCYSGDYLYAPGTDNLRNLPGSREATEAPPPLVTHTKLYGFAEEFNIASLKELSKSKITVLAPSIKKLEGKAHELAVVSTMGRVLGDIPAATEMQDKLVGFLVAYSGILIGEVQGHPEPHGVLHFVTTVTAYQILQFLLDAMA